jgi:hypothetical protein
MEPISPRVYKQHPTLRFSDVANHTKVLEALEKSRLVEQAASLFGASVKVSPRQDCFNNGATSFEIAASKPNALHFAGGFFRNVCLAVNGVDPKLSIFNNGPSGDLFTRSLRTDN